MSQVQTPRKTSAAKILGCVYATPTGLKVGSRGKVQPASSVLSSLPKGAARKIRKALRRAGYPAHASARRAPYAAVRPS